MFKALKMKFAAWRMNRKSASRSRARKTNSKRKTPSFWARVWNAICVPFRAIWRGCKRMWAWICGINLVGMANITLLCAIIVLFSGLILNIVGRNQPNVVLVAKNDVSNITSTNVTVNQNSVTRIVRDRPATLPIKINPKTRTLDSRPINVAHVTPDYVAINQTARHGNVMYGDVIIDSRGAAEMLKCGDEVHGNLYLQNMRKYTLPCNIRIDGNLFLRDVGMLQFCGEFTVTGNIYVNPRSSFGPLPRNARIGGQVII